MVYYGLNKIKLAYLCSVSNCIKLSYSLNLLTYLMALALTLKMLALRLKPIRVYLDAVEV